MKVSPLIIYDPIDWDAIGERVIILPFLGEFGFLINSFIKQVDRLNVREKIVCCRLGEEVYFPSATGFVTFSENIVSDAQRIAYRTSWPPQREYSPSPAECELIDRLCDAYPQHQLVHFANYIPFETARDMAFEFSASAFHSDAPAVDLVFASRRRRAEVHRNFSQWDSLLRPLAEGGVRIGLIGQIDTSQDFDFVRYRCWDNKDPNRAALKMLRDAEVYVGTDSGPTHLAALVARRIVAFRNEACESGNLIDGAAFHVARNRNVTLDYVRDGWTNLSAVRTAIDHCLRDRPRR